MKNFFTLSVISFLVNCFRVDCYQIKNAPLLTKRPSWLKVCRRSDPNLDSCIVDLIATMFPILSKGEPEMNVDSFEPLYLDQVTLSQGSGAITLRGSLLNLQIAGPANATPTYSNVDFPNLKWEFGLTLPKLDIRSRYNLTGYILVLPLLGNGACELRLVDVKTRINSDIEFRMKEGREVLLIDNMRVRFTLSKLRIKLHNLFNGNKVLGDTVNTFINKNGIEIAAELEESIGKSLAGIITDLINNIFSKMPTDLWLLTDEQHEKYLKENKITKEDDLSNTSSS